MSYSITPFDSQLRASLHIELAAASQDSTMRPLLTGAGDELLPRYAHYYNHLAHLPRRARRALQRHWKRSLSALALLLTLGQAPEVLAQTIPVNGTTCTLIDAITAANTDSAVGGCRAGSGADTLQLVPKSTHTLTKVNNFFYANSMRSGNYGLPLITSAITIEGHGSTIRRRPNAPKFGIFALNDNGNLTLNETTVSGASPVAIFNYNGTLTLSKSTVSYNGPGVFNYGGDIHINTTTVSKNRGIGVIAFYGGVTLTNSTVSGNIGPGLTADYGGVTLINSTVSGNHGGGIISSAGVDTITLLNSTVSGNAAAGIAMSYNSYLTLTQSTVTRNRGPGIITSSSNDVSMNRSIVSGNMEGEVISEDRSSIESSFNLLGHSGFTNAQAFSNFCPGVSDITATSNGTNPTALGNILHPTLTRSGGATQTHNLVIGSPAVDAASIGCPPPRSDQRGAPRPQGTACDIGAVELVLCKGLPATLVGTAANNVLTGTSSRDIINGLGGNDRISGSGGNDVLCGGDGSDHLFGQGGNDTLNGGSGSDRCDGGSGTDITTRCERLVDVP
jgi:Ca2+-binding RTX toxin-like protein